MSVSSTASTSSLPDMQSPKQLGEGKFISDILCLRVARQLRKCRKMFHCTRNWTKYNTSCCLHFLVLVVVRNIPRVAS